MKLRGLLENIRQDCVAIVKTMLVLTMPRKFFELQMSSKSHEPEVALVPQLLPAGGVAVDVGANEGLWVYHLQKIASEVIAFEPIDALARSLERKSDANVRVERIALSDQPGTTLLRYPRRQRSWGTIEASNLLDRTGNEVVSQRVDVRTLDSYELQRLSMIKIDVEGHELSVLEGAEKTIERCLPAIIVEVEEVHNPRSLSRVRAFLETRGYRGFFLDGNLTPIEQFDQALDQDRDHVSEVGKAGRYINNFIFLPLPSEA